MPDPGSMPSQDPALESFREDILESGHEELLDNEKRGCGFLDHNATYVRSDVQALESAEGGVPRFVTLEDPVEYREYGERGAIIPGYKPFPGMEFAAAYHNNGAGPEIGGTTDPPGAIPDHQERVLDHIGFDGDHYGEITVARSHDLLMSVGKSHWPKPQDFIEECIDRGLNLKVPSSPNQEPPMVNPMVTRCWVIHPHGLGIDRAAIIGYSVLTRAVYTAGEEATEDDPDIPTYAQEWADAGKVSLATPGEEVDPDADPGEERSATPPLADFEEDDDGE